MAAILQEAALLPAPQPVPLATCMGVEVPQPQPPTAQHYPEGACQAVGNTRPRRRRAAYSWVQDESTAPPTAMQEEPLFVGRRTRNSPFMDPPEMAEFPTAERQRMNPEGDYTIPDSKTSMSQLLGGIVAMTKAAGPTGTWRARELQQLLRLNGISIRFGVYVAHALSCTTSSTGFGTAVVRVALPFFARFMLQSW
eukprot:6217089-Amphidinium_carterae.2